MAKLTRSLLVFIIFISACSLSSNPPATVLPTTLTSDWYGLYFTDPASPAASTYRDGPDEALATAIDHARLGVDVAIYDLNLWSIRDALMRAHRRGLVVRVVTDSDNMDEQEIQEMKVAGIPVMGDGQESLMHDKFVVIDRMEVWTGSMNFTTGGGYLDYNNLIRIQSTRLAEDYTVEFEQMFVEKRFGVSKTYATPYPNMMVNGSLLEVYFSPQDGTLEHILTAINAAQESIVFMAYSFTSDELALAMIERADAGVTVSGVFDEDQYHSNTGTEYDRLLSAGTDVRLDGNPYLMHHKVIIIDGKVVITGSYNFSNNAEHHNDENTLIIHNQDIAALYLAEFQHIYIQSKR